MHGLSPDFLFKCQDGSLLAWEHLGLLGHDGYSDSVLERLNKYLDCGFVVGQNLILTSDNVYGNTNELMILINPHNSERIIYRIYDYQLYVSNEIRNIANPALPAIHAFERYKLVEYQPVQSRVQILNPSGLRTE